MRDLPWFYRKYRNAVHCTDLTGANGIIFDHRKKKRTEVSDPILPVFIGGVSGDIAMRKIKCRGSFTIEAAVYMPFLLAIYLFVMQTGIHLYTETIDMATEIQAEPGVDVLKLFYRIHGLEEVFGSGN